MMAEQTDDPTPINEALKQEQYSSEEEVEADMNLVLISLVKQTTYLYDHKDPRHKDRRLLDVTWDNIGRELGLSGDNAKEKWQRLRNSFLKAVVRRKKIPQGGPGVGIKRLRPWVYETEMEFLRGFLNSYQLPTGTQSRKQGNFSSITADDVSCDNTQLDSPANIISDTLSESGISDFAQVTGPQEENESFTNGTLGMMTAHQKNCLGNAMMKSSEADLAAMPYTQMMTERDHEDPAIGWFRTLLPMIKSLSPIALLDFQAKVVLELRALLLRDEEQKKYSQEVHQ